MALPLIPTVPPSAPRFQAGFMGAVARTLLRLHGWRIIGPLPDHPRIVMAGFPHTSNWDGYFSILFVLAMQLRISLVIKQSWIDGPMGGFMRWLGFVGVDRKKPQGFAEQIAAEFRRNKSFWLGVTPEGTRAGAKEIKTGFQRIARVADALIVPTCIDFQYKTIRVLPGFPATDDGEADTQRVLDALAGSAWPHHPDKLSAPAHAALTVNGELRRPDPPSS